MSENMKNKIVLHNKNIIAYICLVHFQINVKTKMNCKTESYFLIMFSMVGRIWIPDRGSAGWEPLVYSIICIIFISNACLNRLLLEYYLSSAKYYSEVNLRMQLQYALMKGLELCMRAVRCGSVSIIFLMLWFTVIVWEACPCGKWCLDKDKLLAHILTT